MSNQHDQSSVYNEKKIAAYESLFKESSFAKPQEVYLTITVAHLFGQAYVMEQQGTKEGDPVYTRFVCPLEEITKVYINNNVKSSPLFIQCDTDVKGVINRKRIIVPCLDNVAAIVEQINDVRKVHMEKYEANQEKIKEKKRLELEAARAKEQADINAAKTDKLMNEKLAKLPNADEISMTKAEESHFVSEPASELKSDQKKAVKKLTLDIDDALKAFDALERTAPAPVSRPKKPSLDLDSIPNAAEPIPAEKPAPKPAPAEKPAPKPVEKEPEPIKEEPAPKPAAEPAPVKKSEPEAPVTSPAAAPVIEDIAPIPASKAPKPVPTEVSEVITEHAKPAAADIKTGSQSMSLAEFEEAVKKLKAMSDSGVLSAEELAAEKKKLLANLY